MRIKVTSQLDLKKGDCRTSLVWVQWLRFHTSTTGGVGLIPGQRRYTCCALWQKKKKGGDYLGLLGWEEDKSKRQWKSLSERRLRSGEERFEPWERFDKLSLIPEMLRSHAGTGEWPLKAKGSLRLTASKKKRTSVQQLQESRGSQHPEWACKQIPPRSFHHETLDFGPLRLALDF